MKLSSPSQLLKDRSDDNWQGCTWACIRESRSFSGSPTSQVLWKESIQGVILHILIWANSCQGVDWMNSCWKLRNTWEFLCEMPQSELGKGGRAKSSQNCGNAKLEGAYILIWAQSCQGVDRLNSCRKRGFLVRNARVTWVTVPLNPPSPCQG